jgi:hypothetical protein
MAGEATNEYRILTGNPLQSGHLEDTGRVRLEDNIKADFGRIFRD